VLPHSRIALAAALLVAAAILAPGESNIASAVTPSELPPQAVPPSQDKMWKVLRGTKITIDPKRGIYIAAHPPEVKALVGKTVTIEGFVLPYMAAPEFRRFLLVPYAPTCPFCPAAEPNEVIDVNADRPIRAEERLFTVTGRFAIQNDGEKGLFFRLDSASVQ
jgi:hypothetical protein